MFKCFKCCCKCTFLAMLCLFAGVSLAVPPEKSVCVEDWATTEAAMLQNAEKSFDRLLKEYGMILCHAELGNKQAMLSLFWHFYDNYDDLKDKAPQALSFLTKSADEGLSEAQYNLGVMYTQGILVETDISKAESWLKRASEEGDHREASFLLGVNYSKLSFSDYPLPNENYEKYNALSDLYLKKAADAGHVNAMRLYGMSLLSESKIEGNIESGRRYLALAADHNDKKAMYQLGVLYKMYYEEYGDEKYLEESNVWFNKANKVND